LICDEIYDDGMMNRCVNMNTLDCAVDDETDFWTVRSYYFWIHHWGVWL